jgi:hypothetical protein
MTNITKEVLDNGRILLNETFNMSFTIKIIILFIIYLFSNYIIDRLNQEDLIRTFVENPNITIQIPNNVTFKILIRIIMIIASHYVYVLFIRPYQTKFDKIKLN